MAEGTRKLTVEIVGDASKLKRTLADADGDAGRFGSNLGNVVKQGAMVAGAALIGFGAASVNASIEFNKSMANVASLIPGNTDRVKELSKSVQSLSIETGQSTSDMSAALYQVVSAFGDSADAAEILRINARAAVAGVATTSEAIAITSSVTKSYGDTTKRAVADVADLATLTVRLGQTTFPELAGAIGQVAPLAQSAGVSQKELFAVMATGSGVTGTAAQVATQFRQVLQSILAPTKASTEAFEAQGFASGEAALKTLGAQGAIKLLTDAAASSGQPLQNFIGSVEGQTLALALAGPQADAYTAKLAEMANASGSTDKAFAEQTGGVNELGFKWEQLKVKTTVAMQQIGDKLGELVIWMTEHKTATIAILTAVTVAVALVAVAITAAAVSWVAGWVAMSAAAVFNAAIIAVAWIAAMGPIVWVIAAVVAAVAALAVVIWRNWDTIKDATAALGRFIVDTWDWIVGVVSGIGGRISGVAGGMWDGISRAFKAALNVIIRGWNALEFRIPGFSVGPVKWAGFTLGVPNIPSLHAGGTFLASTPGGEGMALLRDRERIVPPSSNLGSLSGHGGSSVSNTYNQNVSIDATGMRPDDIIELIRKYERSNGAGWRGAMA